MVEIAAARGQFCNMLVSIISLVQTIDNPSGGLTKAMQQATLRYAIGTKNLSLSSAQITILTTRENSEKPSLPTATTYGN